jgi:hypothetical protein
VQVCIIFPEKPDMAVEEHSEKQQFEVKRHCDKRTPVFYDKALQDKKVIHFGAGDVRLTHKI